MWWEPTNDGTLFLASCISSTGLCCFRIMWKPSALTYSTWLSPVSFWKPSYNSDDRSIKTWIETRILKRQLAPYEPGNVDKGALPFSTECNLQRTNAWGSQSFTTFWCELEWPVQGVAEYNMRARNSRTLVNNYMGSLLRLATIGSHFLSIRLSYYRTPLGQPHAWRGSGVKWRAIVVR